MRRLLITVQLFVFPSLAWAHNPFAAFALFGGVMLIPVVISIILMNKGMKIYWLGIGFLVFLGGGYLMLFGQSPALSYFGVILPFALIPAALLVRKKFSQSNKRLQIDAAPPRD